MERFIIKELTSNNLSEELLQIGFDEGYRNVFTDKLRHKNIKIYNLTPAQANILKQLALSVGADCGTHREVITGKVEKSDAILCGNISQIKKIAQKLKPQPFKLNLLGENLLSILKQQSHETKLVGILNITPDSFSDGGEYYKIEDAQKHLIKLIEDGADIIDIGAESTRPYSEEISPEVQIERLKPILNFINEEKIKTPISIDTRSSIVAEFALNRGVKIINDVSGFDYDTKIAEVTARYNATIIIQHSYGIPRKMQENPQYKNVVEDIYFKLKEKIEFAQKKGINNIIIDPGIGFGKTRENNFEILNRIEEFHSLNAPIMVGLSRKSLLGIKEHDNGLKDSLSAALSFTLINKIDYLRVHNVKLHKALLNLM